MTWKEILLNKQKKNQREKELKKKDWRRIHMRKKKSIKMMIEDIKEVEGDMVINKNQGDFMKMMKEQRISNRNQSKMKVRMKIKTKKKMI